MSTEQSPQLTREEELALWLEQKRKKKKAEVQRKSNGKRVSASSSGASKNCYSRTSTPVAGVKGAKKVPGKPPRSSLKSVPTPSSAEQLQRARNVLKERNYNGKQTRSQSYSLPRKQSLSHQPLARNHNFNQESTLSSSRSLGAFSMPVSISIALSPLPNLSPLSMCGLLSPSPGNVPSSNQSKTKSSGGKKQDSHGQQSIGDEDVPPKKTFSFEDDDLSSSPRVELRGRRAHHKSLLLPTPSPLDPPMQDEHSQRQKNKASSGEKSQPRRRPRDTELLLPTPSPLDQFAADGGTEIPSNSVRLKAHEDMSPSGFATHPQRPPTPSDFDQPSAQLDCQVQNRPKQREDDIIICLVKEKAYSIQRECHSKRRVNDTAELLSAPSPFDSTTLDKEAHALSSPAGMQVLEEAASFTVASQPRRRTGTNRSLLLPTPSPFDPEMEQDADQGSSDTPIVEESEYEATLNVKELSGNVISDSVVLLPTPSQLHSTTLDNEAHALSSPVRIQVLEEAASFTAASQSRRRTGANSSLLLPTPSPFDPVTEQDASQGSADTPRFEELEYEAALNVKELSKNATSDSVVLLPTPSPFDSTTRDNEAHALSSPVGLQVLEEAASFTVTSQSRRRTETDRSLLLPTPSPFDPVTEQDTSQRLADTLRFDELGDTPLIQLNESIENVTSDPAVLLPKSSPSSHGICKSVPQGLSSNSPQGDSLMIEPSFSFEDEDTESPNFESRRKRKSSFLLLPTPSPFDASTQHSISSVPSPTSAFSKAATYRNESGATRREHQHDVDKSVKQHVPIMSPTSAFSKVASGKNVDEARSNEQENELGESVDITGETLVHRLRDQQYERRLDQSIDDEEENCEGNQGEAFMIQSTPTKLNGKTVLISIVEQPDRDTEAMVLVQTKLKDLTRENRNLQNRLSNIQKAYEQRVTPFRDVFEDMRMLKAANRQMQTENQQLREQKTQVETMVVTLQTQMMTSLQQAVQHSAVLKNELAAANAKIQRLEQESLE